MYLHLGQGVMLPYEDIIGVFDLDNASDSRWTRDFLRNAEEQSVVISVCDDIPRSFVVCDHPYHPEIVYLSQLSSQTLQKRVEQGPLSE
ncbi:MAG: extracellular matrix regulator RemB [Oscillospiraceae bacterium]